MAADSPLHVGVLGAGGIGCWLATRLALAGQRVSLLARGGSLAAIQQNGLRAVAVDGAVIGEFRDPELCAYSSTEELPKGAEVDALIVAVKTHQLAACLPQIAAVLRHSPAALVLPMLNGVESQDVIADGLRAEGLDQAAVANVMGGIAKSIVYISEPGCVVLERELGIAVGPVHTPVAGPSQLRVLQAISQVLTERAGVRCDLLESATAMKLALWTKARAANACPLVPHSRVHLALRALLPGVTCCVRSPCPRHSFSSPAASAPSPRRRGPLWTC